MFSSTFWLQQSVLLNICLCQKIIVQDTLHQILSDVEYTISNSNDGHFACVFQGNLQPRSGSKSPALSPQLIQNTREWIFLYTLNLRCPLASSGQWRHTFCFSANLCWKWEILRRYLLECTLGLNYFLKDCVWKRDSPPVLI